MRIFPLENTIQHYAWGGYDAIPALLGKPDPEGRPCAELWMGAHPSAPSKALTESGAMPLDALIATDPEAMLGPELAARYGQLPFLFKVLSAAEPLSIQAHPSKRKAELGFARENLAGVPLSAPDRNYRDSNHKPEMAVALEPFTALCGFRPADELVENMKMAAGDQWESFGKRFARNPGKVELSVSFYGAVSRSPEERDGMLARSRARLERAIEAGMGPGPEAAARASIALMDKYPRDIGALAPLILNLVELEPGEGIYIGSGILHAYLHGTALEIMANSDNVLRGGLTPKHVDIPELVSTLDFEMRAPERLHAERVAAGTLAYPRRADEFALDRLEPELGPVSRSGGGPEILLCAEGALEIAGAGGARLALPKGSSAFVAAGEPYRVEGVGHAWRAGVGPASGGGGT
ncbi:MAG: mannose-6-phosphate isomerase, class I [Spirochaetales bacterium]|nr:mannose-6-phosphate isomerase, class I [Spirochaetales bacterium]